jgi:hypothetical protein
MWQAATALHVARFGFGLAESGSSFRNHGEARVAFALTELLVPPTPEFYSVTTVEVQFRLVALTVKAIGVLRFLKRFNSACYGLPMACVPSL